MKHVTQDIGSAYQTWVDQQVVFTDTDGQQYIGKCTNVGIVYNLDGTKSCDRLAVRMVYGKCKTKQTYWINADKLQLLTA